MGTWGIGINWAHVAVWRRVLITYLGFVGFCLIAGAHLKPRPDEIAFMLVLPLWVIVPYTAGCLFLGTAKLWLVVPLQYRFRRRFLGSPAANFRRWIRARS